MDIKLGKNDKKYIEGTDDVFSIMQRVLQRDNKIDRDKEHFWIIGMNEAGFILYIELIALGTVRLVPVEPMNVFRVAVMKNATRVIAVHNHPSGRLNPSEADKDITDRLIQVGRILHIELVDHLIISTEKYLSFRQLELMQMLERSLQYVPTYQVVEQIRKEEKAIAKEKLAVANDKIKAEKDKTKTAQEKAKSAKLSEKAAKEQIKAEKEAKLIEKQRREKLELTMVQTLLDKGISIQEIAKIMDISVKRVEGIVKRINR